MKAPWLNDLKIGDVFYVIPEMTPLCLTRMVVNERDGCCLLAREETGHVSLWCSDADYRPHKSDHRCGPIRATDAAQAAHEVLKRLRDEIDAD